MAPVPPRSAPRLNVIDISQARPQPGKGCNVCGDFNPSLCHSDRKRLIKKPMTDRSISFQTSLHQLSEAAIKKGCGGCALLHAAFKPFCGHLAPGHLVNIALRYTERSAWESTMPGTAVLGAIVEFRDLKKDQLGCLPDLFEFFSPEGRFGSLLRRGPGLGRPQRLILHRSTQGH